MTRIINSELVGLYFKFDDDEPCLLAQVPLDPGTFELKLKYFEQPPLPDQSENNLIYTTIRPEPNIMFEKDGKRFKLYLEKLPIGPEN